MKSVFQGQYHYILSGDGVEELYDFVNDPGEQRNLSATAVGDRLLPHTRQWLERTVNQEWAP